MRGDIVAVAMRDIRSGEEITQDYAMIDCRKYEFECSCGAPNCRKIITGQNWKNKELQKKYGKYLSAFIKSKLKE